MAKRNAKGEVFFFLNTAWDIEVADEIIKKKPREPEMIDVTDLHKMVTLPGEPLRFGGIGTDFEIVKKADLKYPIYLAKIKMPVSGEVFDLPIDGWHRIARSKMDGITELPAYRFTMRESNRIKIR